MAVGNIGKVPWFLVALSCPDDQEPTVTPLTPRVEYSRTEGSIQLRFIFTLRTLNVREKFDPALVSEWFPLDLSKPPEPPPW